MIPQGPSSSPSFPAAARSRKGQFTGWHATAILVAFFGVVIAVNVVMARFAISTFGGLVVENSYVASQHFNSWLAEADREKALGWHASFERNAGGDFRTRMTDAAGKPLTGAKVRLFAEHPLGRKPPRDTALREIAPGVYDGSLPEGRWYVRIVVRANGHDWRTAGDVQ